jgi:hypothetical protein
MSAPSAEALAEFEEALERARDELEARVARAVDVDGDDVLDDGDEWRDARGRAGAHRAGERPCRRVRGGNRSLR